MARYRTALRNPNVDIIAHPSGRKIGIRDDLDLDWDAFYREAAETRTVLELNGSDERLDLDDRRARAAKEAGNRFVVDSDAHYLDEFDNLDWGISQARRAWLEPRTSSTRCPGRVSPRCHLKGLTWIQGGAPRRWHSPGAWRPGHGSRLSLP